MIYSISFKSNILSMECLSVKNMGLFRADHFIAVETAEWPEHEITK